MICPTCEYPRQQIGNADAGGIAYGVRAAERLDSLHHKETRNA